MTATNSAANTYNITKASVEDGERLVLTLQPLPGAIPGFPFGFTIEAPTDAQIAAYKKGLAIVLVPA